MRLLQCVCAVVLVVLLMPQNVNANTVYAIDGTTDEIVILDPATGAEQNRFPVPELSSGGPDGLAVTTDRLFFVNGSGSNMIFLLEPETGAVVGSFPAPELLGGTDGLAAMDDVLFSLEPVSDTISRVRISTGESLGACTTGNLAGGGLAADAGRLFATLSLSRIVELDPESCQVIGGPFPIPGGDLAYGLAFDGDVLYAGSIIQPGIHTMDPDTGESLRFLPLPYPPTGLAATTDEQEVTCDFEVDIRPGSTVNIMSIRSDGRLQVALYGSSSLDVGNIEQDSLRLETVPVDRAAFQDADNDGVLDLILQFRIQSLVAVLEGKFGDLEDRTVVEMAIRGLLMDGTGCYGADSVQIRSTDSENEQESVASRSDKRGNR